MLEVLAVGGRPVNLCPCVLRLRKVLRSEKDPGAALTVVRKILAGGVLNAQMLVRAATLVDEASSISR